jgi:riboflavin synthase alpha subunit
LAPFGQAVSEENICLTVANQKQELLLAAIFVESSPLKLLDQIKPNFAGSIYVRYSIKLLHMVPFGQME